MGHAPMAHKPQELAEIRLGHDDDSAAKGHDRQAENARRVSERRQREIDRPSLEWIAHEGQRGHRLEIAARQHHAFRLPRRASGAGDHGDIVERRDIHRIFAHALEPAFQRGRDQGGSVDADEDRKLRQVRDHALDQRFIRAVKDQSAAVEGVENEAVLLRFVTRIDRTPDGGRARDPENAGEGDRIVARQHGDLVSWRNSRSLKRARDAIRVTLDFGVGEVRIAGREARRVLAERGALVEIVDQPHGRSSRGVSGTRRLAPLVPRLRNGP